MKHFSEERESRDSCSCWLWQYRRTSVRIKISIHSHPFSGQSEEATSLFFFTFSKMLLIPVELSILPISLILYQFLISFVCFGEKSRSTSVFQHQCKCYSFSESEHIVEQKESKRKDRVLIEVFKSSTAYFATVPNSHP